MRGLKAIPCCSIFLLQLLYVSFILRTSSHHPLLSSGAAAAAAEQGECDGWAFFFGGPDPDSASSSSVGGGAVIRYRQALDCLGHGASAYVAISLWLAALFYVLANTAADYFCPSLERLANLLRLPPTIAAVTLLPLGNGAPDVFASLVAFLSQGDDGGAPNLGLASILGGALFVTTVVAGLVNAVAAVNGGSPALDRAAFLRDGAFFLASLAALLWMLSSGAVTVLAAAAYLSIYAAYAVTVTVSHATSAADVTADVTDVVTAKSPTPDVEQPLLPAGDRSLDSVVTLPHWLWASQVAVFSDGHANYTLTNDDDEEPQREPQQGYTATAKRLGQLLLTLLHWLLTWPRELTIPLAAEGRRWRRRVAVTSAALAPALLLAVAVGGGAATWPWAAAVAMAGSAAGWTGSTAAGPRWPLAWAAAGFVMSCVWFVVVARELVAALAALAAAMGVAQAALGWTLLAWANSAGDMLANTAMARGGAVQMAVTACYAAPMFNTLLGLGLCLLAGALRSGGTLRLAAAAGRDSIAAAAFLAAAIAASMVSLPFNGMRPARALAATLFLLYAAFLALRATQAAF